MGWMASSGLACIVWSFAICFFVVVVGGGVGPDLGLVGVEVFFCFGVGEGLYDIRRKGLGREG